MKTNKLSLIISLVALTGVIILLIAVLNKNNKTVKGTNNIENADSSNLAIAFVNLDTIQAKYDLFNVLSLQFTKKQQELDKKLQSKMLSLQNKANQLQSQYSQHLITSMTYQQKLQKLQDEQNQIQTWQQKKTYELQEDQLNMQKRIRDSLVSAINIYNKDGKYKIVLSDATEGTVLYVDSTIDISNDIVKILNQRAPVLDSLAQ